MSRRFALVIGNSLYDDTTLAKLKTPEADVHTLAIALRDPQVGGFDDVQEMVNQTEASVRRAISQFFLQKKSDDLLLLYFSGHGVLDAQGRLFLAVKDTQRELLNATAIPSSFISDDMDSCRSKRQILILDCCHSGAFAKGAKGDAPAVTQTTFEGNGFGRVVLTASDSTQYALEGDQVIEQASLSLFTHYLLEGLTTGEADSAQDGWVTLDEWYDYAYDRVVSETPDQTPRKWVYNQQGELVIARNPNPTKPEPADLPDELKLAVQSPFVGVRADAVEELKRLLSKGNPALTQAAYQALKNLADHDDSRRIAGAAEQILAEYDQAHPAEKTPPTETGMPPVRREEIEEAARLAKEKMEAERLAAAKAEADRQVAADRIVAQKAQAEQLRLQQAEAERQAREKAEADRLARERAERQPEQPIAYLPFESEFQPQQFNAGTTAELAISVPGQAPASLTIDFVDPGGNLVFSPPGAQLTIQPGVNTVIRFRAALRRPALVSFKSKYPFKIRIRASTGEAQALAGEVIARPMVPVWSLPLVALSGLCLSAFVLYLAIILPSRNEAAKNATATFKAALAMLATATPPPLLSTTAAPPTQAGEATVTPGIILAASPTAPEQQVATDTQPPPPVTPTLVPPLVTTGSGIVFASNRDGNWEIYRMDLDGSHVTRLTHDPGDDSFPLWSPNGRKILFHSDRAGNYDLYVMNPDGSGLTQLTNASQADTFASWSPDGKKIVFQSKRDGNKEIYVMNADGSKQVRLTKNDVDDQFPSWSPDGKQIIYSTLVGGALQLAVMNANGSGQHQLTRGSESFSFPAWSPDGRWIVAAYETPDKTGIIRGEILSDGRFDYTGLTSSSWKDTQPRWSPDGKSIYYTSNFSGNFDLYRIDHDGGDDTPLNFDPSDEEAPSVYP